MRFLYFHFVSNSVRYTHLMFETAFSPTTPMGATCQSISQLSLNWKTS
jgi:hypothetical protein